MRVLDNPSMVQDDIGSEKQKVMSWCLYEAKLDKERKFVRSAVNTMMSQDASEGKLFMRMSVSDKNLLNMRFSIGLADMVSLFVAQFIHHDMWPCYEHPRAWL